MIYDITSKLHLNVRPVLRVAGEDFTIDNTVPTVYAAIEVMDDETITENVRADKTAAILLGAENAEKLRGMGISWDDYTTVVSSAYLMALGNNPTEEQSKGEAVTPATT